MAWYLSEQINHRTPAWAAFKSKQLFCAHVVRREMIYKLTRTPNYAGQTKFIVKRGEVINGDK